MTEKERLWALIKLIGLFYDEDIDFLKEYAKDVYNTNLGRLDEAIKCFEDVWNTIQTIYPNGRVKSEV